MGGHFDLHQLFGHALKPGAVLTAQTGEHHLFIGVFVVHAKHAARRVLVQRPEADIVVVVTKLLELRFGGLVHHVEVRGVCSDRIPPAQQHICIIAVGDMMAFVIAPGEFVKHVAVFGVACCGGFTRCNQRRGTKKRCCGGDPQHAAQNIAAAIACVNYVADRVGKVGVCGNIIEGFESFGFVAIFGVVDDRFAIHLRQAPTENGLAANPVMRLRAA